MEGGTGGFENAKGGAMLLLMMVFIWVVDMRGWMADDTALGKKDATEGVPFA